MNRASQVTGSVAAHIKPEPTENVSDGPLEIPLHAAQQQPIPFAPEPQPDLSSMPPPFIQTNLSMPPSSIPTIVTSNQVPPLLPHQFAHCGIPPPNHFNGRRRPTSAEEIRSSVFVSGLHETVSEQTLLNLFAQFGPIRFYQIIRRQTYAIAFVTFYAEQSAANSLLHLDGGCFNISGQICRLRVKPYRLAFSQENQIAATSPLVTTPNPATPQPEPVVPSATQPTTVPAEQPTNPPTLHQPTNDEESIENGHNSGNQPNVNGEEMEGEAVEAPTKEEAKNVPTMVDDMLSIIANGGEVSRNEMLNFLLDVKREFESRLA